MASKQWTRKAKLFIPRVFGGHGADTDIIVASAKAYINALNKLIIARPKACTVCANKQIWQSIV